MGYVILTLFLVWYFYEKFLKQKGRRVRKRVLKSRSLFSLEEELHYLNLIEEEKEDPIGYKLGLYKTRPGVSVLTRRRKEYLLALFELGDFRRSMGGGEDTSLSQSIPFDEEDIDLWNARMIYDLAPQKGYFSHFGEFLRSIIIK